MLWVVNRVMLRHPIQNLPSLLGSAFGGLRVAAAVGLLIPACIEVGTLRNGQLSTGSDAGATPMSDASFALPSDEVGDARAGQALRPNDGGRPVTGEKDAAAEKDTDGRLEAGASEPSGAERHTLIYGFNAAETPNWVRYDYLDPRTTDPSVTTGTFGEEGDTPLLVRPDIDSPALIGSYGNREDRLGVFFFDDSGDMNSGDGDSSTRFLPSAQVSDQPFVVTAQLWALNSEGQCEPKANGSTSATGRMVGIKRGTTVYLDRSGDGVWGGEDQCDKSHVIGLPDDIPVGTYSPSSLSGGGILALVRVVQTDIERVQWYYDNNFDLEWREPPDWTSVFNGFGDAKQYFPPTNPSYLASQAGDTVLFDANGNRVWDLDDTTYYSALPSPTWKLAGVEVLDTHAQ